ncbi:hypothetical protein Tco_0530812 [Tanacetum coccineum]
MAYSSSSSNANSKVEAQLVAHQKNQLWYEEKIRFMKIDLDDKTDVLTYHKKLLAEAKKEKEELKAKVEKWHNSSKNLNILLNSQMSARDKAGLRYGDQMNKGVLSYENEVFQSVFVSRTSDIEDSHVNDRYAEGMHAVPPPMTGIYIPSGPDKEIDDSQFTYGPKQSNPSKSDCCRLYDPSIYLSYGHRCYLRNCLCRIHPSLAIELSPTSYLEPRANKHEILRGGHLNSGISSLRSTGSGMYRDGGSGGSGGGGDECADGAMHLARRSLAEGSDNEIGGDGGGVGIC